MTTSLQKHWRERERARVALEKAQEYFNKCDRQVREDEATEIIASMGEITLTPDQLMKLIQGLRANGGVPFPLEQKQENPIKKQEEQTDEQTE